MDSIFKWPEGATHVDPEVLCFYKMVDGFWHVVSDDGESWESWSLYNGETSEVDLIEKPMESK